jgi:hypothetical protein
LARLKGVEEPLEYSLDATEEDNDIIVLVLPIVVALERQFVDEIADLSAEGARLCNTPVILNVGKCIELIL